MSKYNSLEEQIDQSIYNIDSHLSYLFNNKLYNNFENQIPLDNSLHKIINNINTSPYKKVSSNFFLSKKERGHLTSKSKNSIGNDNSEFIFSSISYNKPCSKIFSEIKDFDFNDDSETPDCNKEIKYYEDCIDNLYKHFYKTIKSNNINKKGSKISKKICKFLIKYENKYILEHVGISMSVKNYLYDRIKDELKFLDTYGFNFSEQYFQVTDLERTSNKLDIFMNQKKDTDIYQKYLDIKFANQNYHDEVFFQKLNNYDESINIINKLRFENNRLYYLYLEKIKKEKQPNFGYNLNTYIRNTSIFSNDIDIKDINNKFNKFLGYEIRSDNKLIKKNLSNDLGKDFVKNLLNFDFKKVISPKEKKVIDKKHIYEQYDLDINDFINKYSEHNLINKSIGEIKKLYYQFYGKESLNYIDNNKLKSNLINKILDYKKNFSFNNFEYIQIPKPSKICNVDILKKINHANMIYTEIQIYENLIDCIEIINLNLKFLESLFDQNLNSKIHELTKGDSLNSTIIITDFANNVEKIITEFKVKISIRNNEINYISNFNYLLKKINNEYEKNVIEYKNIEKLKYNIVKNLLL